MDKKTFSKPKSLIIAFGMLLIVIAELLFAAYPLQYKFGMMGLLYTELIVLVTAVIGCVLFRQDPKEMFPLKKPKLAQFFGTLVLWAGMYLAVLTVTLIQGVFFPDLVYGTSNAMQDFLSKTPAVITFLIVALSPAICEEAICRGFIFHFVNNLKNKWLVIVIMGIIFGIFHLDPVRFLPTAILGGALAYIAVKTKNLLYCALFHLVNNAPAALLSNIDMGQSEEVAATLGQNEYVMAAGVYMFLSAAVPWLLFSASLLLNRNNTVDNVKKSNKSKIIVCTVTCILLAVAGIMVTYMGMIPYIKEVMSEVVTEL